MPTSPVGAEEPAAGKTGLLWLMRLVLAAAVCWLVGHFIYLFAQTAGNVGADGFGGWTVKVIAWGISCGLVLAGAWIYMKAAWLAKWVRVPFILLLSIWPLQFVYGFFAADHYYGLAAEFARRNSWEGALEYYQKAIA